jgi:hypothetical protein
MMLGDVLDAQTGNWMLYTTFKTQFDPIPD